MSVSLLNKCIIRLEEFSFKCRDYKIVIGDGCVGMGWIFFCNSNIYGCSLFF